MSVEAPFRRSVTVVGMTCEHCTRSVTEEIGGIAGVRSVDVDLESGTVVVVSERELGRDEIDTAVVEAGFALTG